MTAASPNEVGLAPAAPGACPVCRSPSPRRFLSVGGRDYWQCATCAARFLDPRRHPSRDAEYRHYPLHDNDADDPRYCRFLSKLTVPDGAGVTKAGFMRPLSAAGHV